MLSDLKRRRHQCSHQKSIRVLTHLITENFLQLHFQLIYKLKTAKMIIQGSRNNLWKIFNDIETFSFHKVFNILPKKKKYSYGSWIFIIQYFLILFQWVNLLFWLLLLSESNKLSSYQQSIVYQSTHHLLGLNVSTK